MITQTTAAGTAFELTGTVKVNGETKKFDDLGSEEVSELVRALFEHRKDLNERKRVAGAEAKAAREAKAAERAAEALAKAELRLAKAKARAEKLNVVA